MRRWIANRLIDAGFNLDRRLLHELRATITATMQDTASAGYQLGVQDARAEFTQALAKHRHTAARAARDN